VAARIAQSRYDTVSTRAAITAACRLRIRLAFPAGPRPTAGGGAGDVVV